MVQKYFAPLPVGWGHMTDHWWQFVLIGLLLGSVVIGCSYLLYSGITKLIRYYKSREHADVVPKDVSQRLDRLANQHLSLSNVQLTRKPLSFGVYLGAFQAPPTLDERRVLSQWDLLIVDPLQSGVAEAISGAERKQVLGRVDLASLCSSSDSTVAVIEKIENTLTSKFNGASFSGILLANTEERLNPTVVKHLVEAVHATGLSVFLETAPPDFLVDRKILQTDAIAGLVVRNASIMPDGDKRDYFQMIKMQPTIKAFVSEACMRDFVVMAWETVDDQAPLSNAVVQRSLQWCNFYSAITWIGRQAALHDASLNVKMPEPLSAFSWLKEAEIMKVHDVWRANLNLERDPVDGDAWNTLLQFFPSLEDVLASSESKPPHKDASTTSVRDPPEWVAQVKSQGSPLSISMAGVEYKEFGCFPLGSEATTFAFAEILRSQQRLKSLGLLHPVPSERIRNLGALLRKFHDRYAAAHWSNTPNLAATIKELANFASHDSLRIHLGLDSGLRKSADVRFWAVYQIDPEGFEVFASKNAQGLAGTVLHTFLSARGFPRHLCFEVEAALAQWSKDVNEDIGLPRRLVQDIDALSPEERLLLLQHLSLTDAKNELSEVICSYIRRQLVDAPSLAQLKELNTVAYLEGSLTPEALISSRVGWYRDQGCRYPAPSTCLALFLEADEAFTHILRDRRESDLAEITQALCQLVQKNQIDAYADIMTLSLFSAARKGAFDEIYMEVTDRNPLFNNQSDQAAAFAESFALGSRCEAYFDVQPSAFGKLLSDRFRKYYKDRELPDWVNGAPQMATSYAGAQIDVNPDDKVKPMPGYQRLTFLSVFAVPALIDILLLTLYGRGLYLSGLMPKDQMQSASIALMISLLLSGAVGTWIACGGSYYLISMAFAATNMFVFIRLVAGIAFTIAAGLIGFVVISAVKGPVPGIIFYLYLIALTIYFTAFACLSCFSYPGSKFLSGRKSIFGCVPILFLSPLITTWSGHDAVIYLVVLYIFIGCLLLRLRSTASKWVTWYHKIRRTDDTEIRKWYVSTYGNNDEKCFGSLSDPAVLKLSREALLHDVLAEVSRGLFTRSTKDQLVLELARDWESTNFLLNWYCRYADVPRPIPFSSGWNIQTKVGLDVLRNSQKGQRLHNAFIHWRQSSREIGCGVLYFVLALLDKWVELLTGGPLTSLIQNASSDNRFAIGFGLAYYLIGAVLIDTKAQELHDLIGGQTTLPVGTSKEIRPSQKRDVRFKRKVYWRTLFRYLMWQVWSLALSTALLWAFRSSLEAMILFCAYVLAYTGLLWYQYTKIFSGPQALKPLLAGVVLGLPIGIALRSCMPQDFVYSQVIGLGAATWTVAILTLLTAKIGMPKKVDSPVDLGKTFHAYTTPWADPDWSQQELQTFFERISFVPSDSRLKLQPHVHPGLEVKALLLSRREEPRIEEAFPHSHDLINMALEAWERGEISIELVPTGALGPSIHALSCSASDQLKLAIAVGRGLDQRIDVSGNCQIIAETLLHAVSESMLRMPHEYAVLSESLVSAGVTETMARQLREEANTPLVVRWAKKELLRQLCLGFECDTHWEKLPKTIRNALLDRCLGKPSHFSQSDRQWLQEHLCRFDTTDLDVHVARCNLGAATAVSILDYAHYGTGEAAMSKDSETPLFIPYISNKLPAALSFIRYPLHNFWYSLAAAIKFIIIALVAETEFQREFDHVMKYRPAIIRVPCVFLLNMLWSYSKMVQDFGLSFFLFYGRDNVKRLWDETKGMTISIKKSRFMVQGLDGTFTAFKHQEDDGGFKVYYYAGEHKTEPEGTKTLKYVSTYSKEMLLHIRQEFKDGKPGNEYHYDYRAPSKKNFKLSRGSDYRAPMGRRCIRGDNHLQSVQYNRKGLIEAGSYMKDGNLIRFKYHYRKNPRFGDELLRAEFVLSHITCTVSWCAPPIRHPEKVDRWIPHSKVTEATFVQGADVYEARWLYDHKFHPTIFTTLNGQKIQTPPMIEHDFLGVLAKPKYTSFVHDNPLFYCDSLSSNTITRFLGLSTKRFPVSTSRARSLVWKAWKDRVDFDGIIVRWMDERLLRRDKTLTLYWRCRDRGDLASAKKYLDLRADTVMASADLDDNISSWTPMAIKVSDLLTFGPGGDAVVNTRSKDFGSDTDKSLHVMAADTGTWPNEGGGVSACRRDMINSLRTIKWHMICESANDFGIPKHQTEQNILSLKMIPLWGMDFLTPTHGLFRNKLDSEVENVTSANDMDIKMNFIPILTALVKGARAVELSKADIHQATRALVNLNTYFQESRHWTQVWNSDLVKESWRELWLTQEMSNAIPSSEWFKTELPTLGSLDVALELWYRYLFIFSIPIPEKIPSVFQASHHSVSASYGVVCKIKRNCTLQIWDHAISWRETNLCLSSALCKLSPFVRNALLGLMRITSVITLHHADIISPCADFFNPGWEVEIGTCQGTIEHRNIFRRKVDPVVNGITDMQKFAPVKEIKSERPTVTMLSHVWYAKDIKTALLAADIIINQWKFDEYHLDIYGAIDKAPTYSTECQEIIASKGLRGRVTLRGSADPMKVLENTWLFLNSSLSEGLPLALGEAALTGAPVVCTDVGASLRVLSDPDDFSRFSAVVAPNDALALARAQITMLGMLGEWSQYAEDTGAPAPVLTSSPTAEDVARITRRMYEKSEHRRKLGMMTRNIVQKSFSGDRYLREHEQMLWIGKSAKVMANRYLSPMAEPLDIATALEQTEPIEEEVITIPQSAVHSWRSSAASGISTLYGSTSGYPMLPLSGPATRPASILSSLSNLSGATDNNINNDSFLPLPASASLPIFAPRQTLSFDAASGTLTPTGRRSPAFTRSRRHSNTRSISTAAREQLRGLQRDAHHPYRNSDVSLVMREEFLQSSSFKNLETGK
ncbi:glycosyltransferase family 4 protein [Aspergillus clavatus NRRL 1]|uniref:Glycosyl transferase, group 1 family protein n=1 Tax=Aspergillus clavatus (strain ATCC 1007 / CBS 513.65 / DSM 816 / NCTC 3887 / NRRL 1 / QM 1276 / 107) TaxID=344612 RepID=A1CJQ2_ASPCL|nr:glycosyl transferase, group 1 family protein [Aspergillus clavatus NRRL 1]EAW09376.1 glycosyl transferase, group 1 family protein [Aspergillus clavatus NRRL 1]